MRIAAYRECIFIIPIAMFVQVQKKSWITNCYQVDTCDF